MAKTFTLSKATVEDIDGMVEIHLTAFQSPAIKKAFPHTPYGHAWSTVAFRRDILGEGDVVVTYMIVRDDQTGTIASFSKWIRETGGEAGLSADGKKRNGVSTWQERQDIFGRGLPEGMNEEVMGEGLFEPMSRQHESVIEGQPHYFLEVAATHTEYRRLGLASMMLKWGAAKADEEAVACYLDASPMGKPLYERYGWVGVEEKQDKNARSVPMLRPAKLMDGEGS